MGGTVTQIYLMTRDLDAARRFYRDTLGLDVVHHGERSIEYDTGTCRLKVEADFDRETLAAYGLDPPGEERGSGAIVVLEVADVNEVHDRATETGADVVSPPRDVPWGRRMFLVRDPDGYVIEVSRPIEE